MDNIRFNFEELGVWKKAIHFAKSVIAETEEIFNVRKHFRLTEQLEAASTSVASNIAEGAGRFSRKEFINFLYIARGSLFESLTILTIFERNNWMTENRYNDLRLKANEINRMLSGLINSIKSR